MKDHFEDKIWKVLEQPVSMFRETSDTIYCIISEKSIVQVDYFGNNFTVLYEANYALDNLELLDNSLYFIENEHIMVLNLETREARPICYCPGIDDYYFKEWFEDWNTLYGDENFFLYWTDQDGYLYGINKETGESTMLEPESGK